MIYLFWAATALQSLAPSTLPPPAMAVVEREAWVMGTRLTIRTESERDHDARTLAETALKAIESTEALLSTWRPDTPLARLNRAPVGRAAKVSAPLRLLLAELDAWTRRTDGAFDARIGALIDAWDLRGPGRVPDEATLGAALRASGPPAIDIGDAGLVRNADGAWIDAGGFGKGAALRRVVEELATAPGGAAALLDLGGQTLALGPDEEPWTVGVAHPERRVERVAALSFQNRSAATTGSSERGRHVLDPRTGAPVVPWGSVTVVDVDPLAADVLSTALYVMGPREGFAWAQRAGVAALFLESTGGSVRATWTSQLEPSLLAPETLHHNPQRKEAP